MSFSSEVKEELSRQLSRSRYCQLAEIAAILGFSGRIEGTGKAQALVVHTENVTLARKYFSLIKMTFEINASVYNTKEAIKIYGFFQKITYFYFIILQP